MTLAVRCVTTRQCYRRGPARRDGDGEDGKTVVHWVRERGRRVRAHGLHRRSCVPSRSCPFGGGAFDTIGHGVFGHRAGFAHLVGFKHDADAGV